MYETPVVEAAVPIPGLPATVEAGSTEGKRAADFWVPGAIPGPTATAEEGNTEGKRGDACAGTAVADTLASIDLGTHPSGQTVVAAGVEVAPPRIFLVRLPPAISDIP